MYLNVSLLVCNLLIPSLRLPQIVPTVPVL